MRSESRIVPVHPIGNAIPFVRANSGHDEPRSPYMSSLSSRCLSFSLPRPKRLQQRRRHERDAFGFKVSGTPVRPTVSCVGCVKDSRRCPHTSMLARTREETIFERRMMNYTSVSLSSSMRCNLLWRRRRQSRHSGVQKLCYRW